LTKINININSSVNIVMSQATVNNSIIEIFIGDLSNTEYEAVVIPTNSRLLPSGDLRCRVLRKAGSQVQIECNALINKISKIGVGDSVMTSGGKFCNYLIHTNGPRVGQGNEGKKLMLSTWNSLKVADAKGLVSIVFPPISKEMRGFTAKLIAEAMLSTIKKYLIEKNTNLRNISICVENQSDFETFENVLGGLIAYS
jgi:O-acetyl-ADP-ribose deacetylase (regulator of RNase III)